MKSMKNLALLALVAIFGITACDDGGDDNEGGGGGSGGSFTFEYELGDTGPGGGKIFYRSATGFTDTATGTTCHYLEAAPSDMATTLAWASTEFTSTNIAGTANEIGTGGRNTALILATDVNAPAAKACKDYNGGGKSDWFLPSNYEMRRLKENGSYVGNIGGGTTWYWSSYQSQTNATQAASVKDSSSGGSQLSAKSTVYTVRAIRAF